MSSVSAFCTTHSVLRDTRIEISIKQHKTVLHRSHVYVAPESWIFFFFLHTNRYTSNEIAGRIVSRVKRSQLTRRNLILTLCIGTFVHDFIPLNSIFNSRARA